MINDELRRYVKAQRDAGIPDETTKKALLEHGWHAEDVSQAISSIIAPQARSRFVMYGVFAVAVVVVGAVAVLAVFSTIEMGEKDDQADKRAALTEVSNDESTLPVNPDDSRVVDTEQWLVFTNDRNETKTCEGWKPEWLAFSVSYPIEWMVEHSCEMSQRGLRWNIGNVYAVQIKDKAQRSPLFTIRTIAPDVIARYKREEREFTIQGFAPNRDAMADEFVAQGVHEEKSFKWNGYDVYYYRHNNQYSDYVDIAFVINNGTAIVVAEFRMIEANGYSHEQYLGAFEELARSIRF